ncbi:MAG: MFS transporter [Chloroflexota bacterium]
MVAALATARAVVGLPALRRLIPAFLAFSIGEWASWIGLIVYAYSQGGPAEAGIVAGIVFVPSIVVAPAASAFGDRRPRAQVLVAAYAVQSVAMGATAIALFTGPPVLAYGLATVAATSITLARPAHAALLPEIVQTPDELAIANAASGMAEGFGALIGPLTAGLLISLGGPATVYAAIAVLALGSTIAVVPLARLARPIANEVAPLPRPALIAELSAGLTTVIHDRRLLAVFAILSGSIALLGAFNVLMTVIAIDLLGGDESSIGYLAAVAGLGSVGGAALTGALMRRERLATAYVSAAFVFAGSVAAIGLGPGAILIVGCVVAAGVGWAFVYVEAVTLAQRLAGDDVMSRVFGIMESSMMASQSLGALIVPVLIVLIGDLATIVACGLGFALVVAVAGPTLILADRVLPGRSRQLRALRNVPMFGPLSAPVLDRLATASVSITVEAGERIITAGEVGDRFYLIAQGEVQVVPTAGAPRRLAAGDSFGEIALLRDVPRTATVTAVAPTELLALDRGPFLEALTGQPRSRALADATARSRLDADALSVAPLE